METNFEIYYKIKHTNLHQIAIIIHFTFINQQTQCTIWDATTILAPKKNKKRINYK
jgi:hypothetical protein